jgi:hypothetical protein
MLTCVVPEGVVAGQAFSVTVPSPVQALSSSQPSSSGAAVERAPVLVDSETQQRRGAAAAPPERGAGVERLELALHRLNAVLDVGSGQRAMSSAAGLIKEAVTKLAESAGVDPSGYDDDHVRPDNEQLSMGPWPRCPPSSR